MEGGENVAVILAAGEGKRMRSRTSKVLHKICGKPMIEWVCRAAGEAGVERTVVVAGSNMEQLRDCLGDKVEYALQQEQLGTGHALMSAKKFLKDMDGLVVVLYGDAPLITAETIKRAFDTHGKNKNDATVLTAIVDNPEGYGRIVRDSCGNIRRIVEHKDAGEKEKGINEINSGVSVFNACKLTDALAKLDNCNSQGEYYLTDVIEAITETGGGVGAYVMEEQTEAHGINDRVQLKDAASVLRNRILKDIMLSGVTIMDPATTYIDAGISIGTDTVIYPGTILEGQVKIGECCVIGPDTRIADTDVGNNVEIRNSVLNESVVGDGTKIGPYANIRPNSKIGRNARIGDFTEVKNSVIGDGTKVPHLSYVGDADVGCNVNIGCGVVFVNYNGMVKNRTIVGDNAFIGCNTNLVAPVVVEKNSYVAAGSTITDVVPENSLAIARERQVVKENWVTEKRMKRG